MLIALDELRRFTVTRNFPTPTTLNRALQRMGFVQADPIRAPARAQDLILRHRMKDQHTRHYGPRYSPLDLEENVFVNHRYFTPSLPAFIHPRSNSRVPADNIPLPWP